MPELTPTRAPAVAGRFYPDRAELLQTKIRSYLEPGASQAPTLACIVPHAGYDYSGHVAGAVYSRLAVRQRCLILCPNHTGHGHPLAIMSHGSWQTPLGLAPIDSVLAEALKLHFPLLTEDAEAHRHEHSIEVQLPFLQTLRPDFTFVPIALGTRNFDVLETLGLAIAEVLSSQSAPVLLISSSDMNHYENDAITRIKDHRAIAPILELDARGLYEVVTKEDISMCGLSPTVVAVSAARKLGARRAELIKYATSGDISEDRERVVGYAGISVA